MTGNFVVGDTAVSRNNLAGGVQCDQPDSAIATQPFLVERIAEQTAQQAYEEVLKRAGASYRRDAIDARVANDARAGIALLNPQKKGIIDSQKDVGGWVTLKQEPAPTDSDADGMPDRWEASHGLDPQSSADASQFKLDEQYTNVEVYLNSLVL
ncbi:hypothetical protein [Spirosoma telluris]|uniref:hypothetical protein n=1 Tax=Spirosoma telluris TaxID=2183553 RepID=UPI002FC31B8F